MRGTSLFLLLALSISLNGCVLAPFIDSFKQIGATKQDRLNLLEKRVKLFHDLLYWGKNSDAYILVAEDNKQEIEKKIKALQKVEKIIESKVSEVTASEDGYDADVEVQLKTYNLSTLIVDEKNQNEHWRFTLNEGWRLVSWQEASS